MVIHYLRRTSRTYVGLDFQAACRTNLRSFDPRYGWGANRVVADDQAGAVTCVGCRAEMARGG